ncbi:MAG: BatA domain-containing protein [Planctomycetota bacterium]
MSFLSPWVLWALPLALVPLVIHLVHRRRHRTVEWGAMMFLLEESRVSRGRQRLREVLLLVARTVAILGLVLGVGRPLAGGWAARVGGEELGAVVLVVDRSASMSERTAGTTTKLELGLREARAALEALGEGAELVVVDAARPEEVRAARDASGLDALGLAATTDATSDLPAAALTAARYLEESRAGRAEVWIVSDGQSSDWRLLDGRWATAVRRLEGLEPRARVRMFLLGERARANRSVRVERARRVPTGDGFDLVLDLVVRRESGASVPAEVVPVSLQVGGGRSSVDVDLEGDEGRLVGHRVPLAPEAEQGFGAARIPGDARGADDVAYFVWGAAPTLEAVVVTDRADVARVTSIAAELPLGRGLDVTARTLSSSEARDPERLSLDTAALCVWHAPLPEGGARGALSDFLDSGGALLVLPVEGDADTAPFLGARFGGWQRTASADGPARPASWREDDDLLRTGDDGTPLPVGELEVQRRAPILVETDADVTADAGDARSMSPAVTLAELKGGAPLLVRTGAGLCYFLGVLPTTDSSSLAVSGVVWVGLVQRALEEAAKVRARGASLDAAWTLELGAGWRRAIELEGGRSALEGGVHAGVLGDGERFVAVNRPLDEDRSGLEPGDALRALFGDVEVVVEEGAGGTGGLAQEIWRLFLALALAGLVLEALLCAPEGEAARERVER